MNIVMECDVVLSKKVEAICDDGEPISIHITSVSGNKGRALVRMSCKPGVSDKDVVKIGETSLMFKINSVSDDVKTLEDDTRRVGNLMGGVPNAVQAAIARTSPGPQGEPYVDRRPAPVYEAPAPAPVSAPTAPPAPDALKIVMAALAAAGIPIPGQIEAMHAQQTRVAQPARPAPPPDNCIMTYDDLMAELNALPGVDNLPQMPTNRKLTPREAEMIMSQMPRLRRKAYIRNNLQSQLMIGDLFTTLDGSGFCLAMLPGAAFDMTRLPARNILNSTDLRYCFETGKVELVNTAMYAASFKKVQADIERNEPTTLPVYSGESRTSPHDSSGGIAESLAAGSGMADEKDAIHIGGQGSDPISVSVNTTDDRPPENVYEESPQMQALIGQLPSTRQPPTAQPRRMR